MTTIDTITVIRAPLERVFDLARSVEVHLAGNLHCGEQAVASGGITSGLVGLGEAVTWRAKHFGVWHQLTSRVKKMDRPTFFQDVQIRGIFREMRHDHFFRSIAPAETEMRDVFTFAAPLPILGRLAEPLFLQRYMRKLLDERNAAIQQIAESDDWRRYLP